MIKVECNVCGGIIECYTTKQITLGLLEYLVKEYANGESHLCNKCWVKKRRAEDLAKIRKQAKKP
jgi:hypothetical protein